MSQERVFQIPGGIEYRVTHAEPTPFVEVRAPRDDAPWHIEPIPGYRRLAAFAAEMEARANEYHDTTMKQAKRIAMLEEAVESYQMRILELERILTPDQRRLIPCPCGGGPDHGAEWCSDFT
jgi:hypothetical protein